MLSTSQNNVFLSTDKLKLFPDIKKKKNPTGMRVGDKKSLCVCVFLKYVGLFYVSNFNSSL